MAFNTCQVCNPSPKAYFVQNGKNFICQNCKNSLKSYYTDEYLELIKMHLPMFEDFGQKVQFVLENSEAYTNPEMGYADRKWRMEDLIGNENKDGLLFSKEEKYKINMIDCYREIEGKKHYELCIVVNVKGGKDIYLFSEKYFANPNSTHGLGKEANKKIEETTNNTQEDVMKTLKDEEYIDSLIDKYWFLTNEIKQDEIYYSLEGYLFPDTYAIKNKDVTVEEIFEKMLDKMEIVLEQYKDEIAESKYSVHEILTIASIIETESMSSDGRKDVASVIYNRLNRGMAIQSDVTTYYAVKVDMGERDLYQKELDTYNAYNTRGPNMEGKLPIGPVASVSKSSIEAALEPTSTDYLFFVADKNGKLYFTKTASEHNRIINDLRAEGLWFEY